MYMTNGHFSWTPEPGDVLIGRLFQLRHRGEYVPGGLVAWVEDKAGNEYVVEPEDWRLHGLLAGCPIGEIVGIKRLDNDAFGSDWHFERMDWTRFYREGFEKAHDYLEAQLERHQAASILPAEGARVYR